ncbi:chemotaxis protein MotB [Kushneria sinocarnis]|uniref:Chemotaxis protein MotB n=1 Tax=Kushneria sinocarnis TaxID=595502 RepID=A0A420X0B4_9GAMM|nr:OmpA family protein [Kushneria sinocarnis]RKR07232.1 chemotaxis protein MotB [Kushneria sinocarnis]
MSEPTAADYQRPAARSARADLSRYALIEPPPRHEDGQGSWLMSYLDLLTLLITLFVLLLSLQGLSPEDTAAVEPAAATDDTAPLPRLAAGSALWQLLEPAPARSIMLATAGAAAPPALSPMAVTAAQAVTRQLPVAPTDEAMPLLMTVAALQLPRPSASPGDEMARWAAQVPDIDGVVIEPGEQHVTFRIQDRLLFSSADVELSEQGHELLDRLAGRLSQFEGEISIEGHTDSRSISTERFPSNWELSAARATAVLHHLVDHGVTAGQLRAIGYGASRPLADNASARGRARNRRVELVLRPAASDLADAAQQRSAGQ